MAKMKRNLTDTTEVNENVVVVNPFDRTCKMAEDDANAKLEAVRAALIAKNLEAYGNAMTALKKAVGDWNILLSKRKYTEFLEADNPIIAAVDAFRIETRKIKEERAKDSETITSVNIEVKKDIINLAKFCEFSDGQLSLDWAHDSAKLLALLSLRETDVYAIKPSELTKKSFYFISAANAKKNGDTPDSNTQIVRLLQKIIDEAIFVDDGTGKNKYKCTSHDIAFIQDAVTKMDTKEKCTIAMLNERQFRLVMMNVFAHCLGVAYKVKPAKVSKENA